MKIRKRFVVRCVTQSRVGIGRTIAKAAIFATAVFGFLVSSQAGAQVTSTSLVSSENPSEAGQEVVFTSTVSPVPNGGVVVFSEGGVPLSGCDARLVDVTTGVATCSFRYGTIGSHVVTAAFTGSGTFLVSGSTPLTQVVDMASSTSTALISSANPSIVSQQVVYTATVSAAPDGGTIEFRDDGTTIPGCDATAINNSTGEAACAVTYDVVGFHPIEAIYSGNASFPASTSSTLTQTVEPVATAASLASSVNPSGLGEQVFYTATVSPAPAGGTVAFIEDGSTIAACAAQAVDPTTGISTCAVPYVAVGSYSIEALFSGDASYGASSTTELTQTVNATAPSYTIPGTYLYTVAPGVSQVTFDLYGAEGGSRECPGSCGPGGGPGGLGGKALATIAVTAGDMFQVSVGAKGTPSDYYGPTGGGGATDVRQGTCAATLNCEFTDRIIIAGGGGGSGNHTPVGHWPPAQSGGGHGSGGDGQDGQGDGGSINPGGGGNCQPAGGGGGTRFAGGAGGLGYIDGSPGTLGLGGVGGQPTNINSGSGGDGYYGGGGGGAGIGFQGQSCDGLGGGGGSGYITPAAIVALIGTGVQSGNGAIVISAIQLDTNPIFKNGFE